MRHSWQYLFRDNRPPLDAPRRGDRHHHCPRRFLDLLFAEAITHNLQAEAKLSAVRTQRCPSVIPEGAGRRRPQRVEAV